MPRRRERSWSVLNVPRPDGKYTLHYYRKNNSIQTVAMNRTHRSKCILRTVWNVSYCWPQHNYSSTDNDGPSWIYTDYRSDNDAMPGVWRFDIDHTYCVNPVVIAVSQSVSLVWGSIRDHWVMFWHDRPKNNKRVMRKSLRQFWVSHPWSLMPWQWRRNTITGTIPRPTWSYPLDHLCCTRYHSAKQ